MIESSAVDVSAGGAASTAVRDRDRPAFGPRRRRRAGEQLDDEGLDAAEHVAEAERHRRREQQADRPEDEQREAAGAARDEPAVAQLLPLGDAAAPVQQRADGDADRRAERR